jgi:uncharacterized protein Yka (UPF0111/DUF47 family)
MEVLLWSAHERVGTMAFMAYGDRELVYEALEALPRGTVRRGEPLNSILGRQQAMEFMKDSLRLCRESYERKDSRILLVDRLRCQLLLRAQKRGGSAAEILVELATLAVEAALAARDALRAVTRPMPGLIARSYERVQRWEEKADERLNRIRKLNLKEPQPLLPVAAFVDDAMDALEDLSDLARVLEEHFPARSAPPEMVALLEEAMELALRAAQLFFRVLRHYRELLRGGIGEALFDAIDELKQTEQQGDRLKRSFRWRFLTVPAEPKLLLALQQVQDALEESINAMSRAGFLIHDLAYDAMERSHA